jgi:hypothetical protein
MYHCLAIIGQPRRYSVSATLMIRDETATGVPVHEFPLEFQSERITVRELIRERVYQEVSEYNFRSRREDGVFRGLVQPTDAERTLNGFKVRRIATSTGRPSSPARSTRSAGMGSSSSWMIVRQKRSTRRS